MTRRRILVFSFLCALLFTQTRGEAVEFTRSITLNVGWNSIWLDVEPTTSSGRMYSVENVFTNPAVTIVAMPTTPVGSAEFITEANEQPFNQEGWRVWRRNSELGENSLVVVEGNKAYLVFVNGAAPVPLSVTGAVWFHQSSWVADSYNLLGFNLTAPVSFDDFFASASSTHPVNRIFQLQADGNWVSVNGSNLMQANQAYWIFAEGPSHFAGPVSIRFNGTRNLDFGDGPGTIEVPDPQGLPGDSIRVQLEQLTFSNPDQQSHDLRITKAIPLTSGAAAFSDALRIYDIIPEPNTPGYTLGAGGQITAWNIGRLDPQSSRTLLLGAHRNWTTGGTDEENLYRLEIDNLYFWLPVAARNPQASDASDGAQDSQNQGLWVGEVVLNQVTSLTESGFPLKVTSSTVPLRTLIHVSELGQARLLDHVTLMQIPSADPEVPPELVLVADDTRIPQFGGVEMRAGKKVGRRLETVGYDLPRRFDLSSQGALIPEVATAFGIGTNNVAVTNIQLYVNSRNSRPPALVETYHHTWPLTGGFGANKILRTSEPINDNNNNGISDPAEPFTDVNSNGVRDAEMFVDDNGNGFWDDAEPFTDQQLPTNGVWDAAELFNDVNGNGQWDVAELFNDVNSNGVYDVAESFLDLNTNFIYDLGEPFTDLAPTNGLWDDREPFTDATVSNGIWDTVEAYFDANSNGVYDTEEPYSDLDNNGVWDDPEVYVDVNTNGMYDAEAFSDSINSNGYWDDAEGFTDLNDNGVQDASPLILDPFHRSNPFRHAFHPSHGAGYAIMRDLIITFDEKQQAGILVGTYEETVTGLTAVPLVMKGRIRMQRVSEEGDLQ